MIISIESEAGHVQAMGHRVAIERGGEAELRRRVLASLAQLDEPPDEIRFERARPPGAEDETPFDPIPADQMRPVAQPVADAPPPAAPPPRKRHR